MPALSFAKHEAFARAIVEGKSGREAYRAAGYAAATDTAADSAASRLLKTVKVSARVEELKAEAAEASKVTAARVLSELAKIAFANMADYMQTGADGDPYLDFSKLTRDQAAALQEVSVEDFRDGRSGETLEEQAHGGALRRAKGREIRKVRFKLYDKRAALVDLGKHLGIFRERYEMTGKDGGPIEIIRKTLGEIENDPLELPDPAAGEDRRPGMLPRASAVPPAVAPQAVRSASLDDEGDD